MKIDTTYIFKNDFASFMFINDYCIENPDMDPPALSDIITNLLLVKNAQISVIGLSNDIEI